MIRQVVCRRLWEPVVGCSIHPSRTSIGGLTEGLKVPDCKSGLNARWFESSNLHHQFKQRTYRDAG